jgi:uncharacterized protein YdcH (DUF465 family)
MPGKYQVILTANGKSYPQELSVKMDPRVKVSPSDLQQQFDVARELYAMRGTLVPVGNRFDDINEQLSKLKEKAAKGSSLVETLNAFEHSLKDFGPPRPRPGQPPTLFVLESTESLFNQVQRADAAPTVAVKAAVTELKKSLQPTLDRWRKLLQQDLPALNQRLQREGLGGIKVSE